MRNTLFVTALLFCTNVLIGQEIESHRVAANLLWTNYDQDPGQPSVLPDEIPLDINIPNLDKEVIPADYNSLKDAIVKLAGNNGGVISFSNTTTKTISFNDINKVIDVSVPPNKPYKTILIQGADKIIFNGSNKSSIFVVRKQLRLIVQNAVFQNALLTESVIKDPKRFRVGGGAMEISSGAALRVRGCTFQDNSVAEYDDTPGGGYDGVGENQNGAGIRFNYNTTGEIFDCTFKNCRAVTGGAVAGTSINKLTVINSVFDGNISTAYNTKNSTNRRIVEGAGAIRVDRTAKPLEIYGTRFINNAGNLKVSVIEVFIYPLRVNGQNTGAYPDPNGFALIIDNCLFENNKYYNFEGAVDPERGDGFFGCLLFHSGSVNANSSFVSAKMKIANSKFIGNETGQANLRIINDFLIENSLFANTKMLQLKDKSGNAYNRGAIMLQKVPNNGEINNCTFYNNEPVPTANNRQHATGVFFFGNEIQSRVTLNNSIFYRQNINKDIKQVILPLGGSGNNQFVPGADMSLFADVSTLSVNKTNPNITPNNIEDMCLGTNSLPVGIGGLSDCTDTSLGNNSFDFEKKPKTTFYPNPAKEFIQIKELTIGDDLIISDIQGKTMMDFKVDTTEKIIEISDLRSGLYIISVNNNKQMMKLIVE